MPSAPCAGTNGDDMSAAVATLALSTARMVDDVIADPAVAQYAKAKTSVCHLSVLTHLAKMVGTEPTEDAFSQLLAELSEPSKPEDDPRWP